MIASRPVLELSEIKELEENLIQEIHRGNYPDDSKGCLLLGSSRTIDFVGNSKITLPQITNYVMSKNWLVKLNIFNAFK